MAASDNYSRLLVELHAIMGIIEAYSERLQSIEDRLGSFEKELTKLTTDNVPQKKEHLVEGF